ncbi:MAG TPA: hypothetical protein VKT73_01575 [Xanthobacteraceae bacterium]|nr:hypothetical protein [Xanthobacteraceae bacterium]
MSLIVGEPRLTGNRRALPAFFAHLRTALPLIAVVIAAIALRFFIILTADVSWLITLAEKVLDGNRLYIDFIETNPPASILIYAPAVALARALGLAPETVVNAFVFLAAGVSLWIASRILLRARLLDGVDGWTLAAFAALLLLVFPAQSFAQREHIAVIVLLPALAVYVARAQGIAPGLAAAIIAGIGIGITVSIKPHFAFAVLLAAAASAWHAKSWRPLFAIEHWIAGIIVAIYGASILVFFPQYVSDVLPLLQAIYLPTRQPWFVLFTSLPILLWLLSVLLLAGQKQWALWEPRFSVPLMASCGFVLAYLVQGKAWSYQTYPMLALSLLAVVILLSERVEKTRNENASTNPRAARLLLFVTAAGFFFVGFNWMHDVSDFTSLAGTIRQNATRPKMLVISEEWGLGHPLVRQVRGQWVQRFGSLWITECAEWLLARERSPAGRTRLESYMALDRAMLLEDIRRQQPDIILLDSDWEARTRADPALSEELKAYDEVGRKVVDVGRAHEITILRRQSRETPPAGVGGL